jgi:hypothetical protein
MYLLIDHFCTGLYENICLLFIVFLFFHNLTSFSTKKKIGLSKQLKPEEWETPQNAERRHILQYEHCYIFLDWLQLC